MHPPNSAPARAGSNGPEELPRVGPRDESSVPHPGLVLHAEPLAVDDRGAAVLLGISRAHFRRLAATGRVPAPFRLGRRTLWAVDRLRTWVRDGGGRP